MIVRAIVSGISLLALSTSASTQTVPPWNPGALPTAANWNAYFSQKQDLLPVGGPGIFGLDMSPQGGFGYAPGATEYPMLMGGQTGTGGSMVCVHGNPIDPTQDVNCSVTAENNGSIYLNNGWGGLVGIRSPAGGGGVHTSRLWITAASGSTPADISSGSSNSGVAPTAGGQPVITTANLSTLYALNPNGDFWFDPSHNGTLTSQNFGEIAAGWRAGNGNGVSGKLSFQRVGVEITGYVYAEQINVVAGGYSPAATDIFYFETYMTGGEAAPLEFGDFNAQPINYQICLDSSGLTYPYVQPVYWDNNGAGGTWRSYVTTVTLSGPGAVCFKLTIPGDTASALWWSVSAPDRPSLVNGIDTGSGGNFSTTTLNTWQNGDFRTTPGAGQLVAQAAGAYLQVTGVHNRLGSMLTAPYQALPYAQEMARAQNHYFTTFPPGVTPTVPPGGTPIPPPGVNTGEFQFTAQFAGTGNNFFSIALPFTPSNATNGNGSTTFLNPVTASSSHCRDETANADGGVVTVLSWKPNQLTGVCPGASTGAVGDVYGINILIDSGM